MSEADTPETPRRSRRSGFVGFLRDLVVILLVAFLVSFLLKTFLVRSFYIPSVSMEQTLKVNDRILVNQLVPGVVPVHRGDVVVFKDPGGWLLPRSVDPPQGFERVLQSVGLAADTSHEYVVKRVIGIGGDRVECCDADGRVTVNGIPLDEPYIVIPPGEERASKIDFDVTVPQDSRYNQEQPGRGFVPESEIVGRAFLLNWPLNRFTWLGTPEGTFTGVEEARQ
jgi:signal peptidase I